MAEMLSRARAIEILDRIATRNAMYGPSGEHADIKAGEWADLRRFIEGAPTTDAEPQRCTEADGCPTEMAVLKRFWRAHQRPQPKPWYRRLWCALDGHGGIAWDAGKPASNAANPWCKRCGAAVSLIR